MDKILAEAIANKIEEESKELVNLKEMISNSYEWTEPVSITDRLSGIGKYCSEAWKDNKSKVRTYLAIGVYKIIHKDYGTMYIGQGNIGNRKHRHLQVFKNNGNPVIYGNSTSDSPAGRKMYTFDDNIDNWLFSYVILDNKKVCTEYETLLTEIEEPEFNNLSMSGKS